MNTKISKELIDKCQAKGETTCKKCLCNETDCTEYLCDLAFENYMDARIEEKRGKEKCK